MTLRGDVDKCLLTPDREPTTHQSKGATRVQLEPLGFIGVSYRSLGEGRYRSRSDSEMAAPPEATQHGRPLLKAANLERTAHLQAAQQARGAFSGSSIVLSLSRWLAGVCFLQEAALVSASGQLSSSESVSQQASGLEEGGTC